MATPIERIFLDWTEPALATAAARLVDHYTVADEARMDRATVVLPGGRAGRRLTELLLEAAERQGVRLVPPRVTTVGALPELLYEPEREPADPVLARRVWALTLRDAARDRIGRIFPRLPERGDLPGWMALARQVERLHREVGGAGLYFRDVVARCREGLLFDDGERWAVLAEAQAAYIERLRALGRDDREAARIAALERRGAAMEQEVWLVGVVELPAITRRLLAAVAAPVRALVHAPAERAADFDAAGCVRTEAWIETEVRIPDQRIRFAGGPADQAAEALLAIASLAARYTAEEITVGAPDPQVVPVLQQRLAAAGLPVRYAAGVPLARTGPWRLLAAAATYLDGRRFDALAAMLRHPDLWRWLRRRPDTGPGAETLHTVDAWLGAADRYHRERLPAHVAGGPSGGGTAQAAVAAVVGALESDPLLGRLHGRRRLADWAPEILALLVEVYGAEPLDRAAPDERRIIEACERIASVAAALHRLPEAVDEPCNAGTAIRLLLAEAEGDAVPETPEHAAIELLGWLELHLDDAPALIVTGVNDPWLPESVSADAFLPNALRSRLGLPDNEMRYARDAYLLMAILRSRPDVVLVAGRRDAAGDPLRPSRLLFAAPARTVAERIRWFFEGEGEADGDAADRPRGAPAGMSADAASDPAARFRLPPEPELSAPEPMATLRVTDFRLLLQDPYRFALERMLGLETLDDAARELDGASFGSLAHAVLGRFGAAAEARSADAAVIARRLDALLDEEAARRFGGGALPAVRVQLEQIRARLHAFAPWHAERVAEGWQVEAVEVAPPDGGVPFDVDGTPILLRGRIDRIDHHPESGAWAVFDYKTSDRGDPPEKTHRNGRGDGRHWVDLQLPLYRHLLRALRRPDGAPLVPPAAVDDAALGYILLPRDPDAVGAALADWGPDDLADADEAARDAVRLLRANRFVFDPARAAADANDGFGRLLGVGQLAGGGDGDDEEESAG